MPPPGWPSDDPSGWSAVPAQIPLPKHAGTFMRLFGLTVGEASPRDDASSVDSRQEDSKPTFSQQPPSSSARSKSSRASTASRRGTKQASIGKSSHRRSRKGASRDDHDQEGDCVMGEADGVTKKQEDNGPWACPFFRRDPTRHMDCITLTLNRIQDVKQHLTRRHTAEFSCSFCFEEFTLRQDWEEHVRLRTCQERPCPPHRVSPQAQDRLKVRVDRTLTASEQWYEIWRILFEGEKLPNSPQQGSVIGEVISIIRDCWEVERGQILSELARSEGISENDAGILGTLLGGLLDRVQDRVDPVQRDSGASEATSNAGNSTPFMPDQAGRVDIGIPVFLAPPSDHDATPRLSKSPSPPTPILPEISGSNFQSLKLEQFAYDPSRHQDQFDQMMEQPYSTSTEDDELTTMTFSGQLEGNCLESRGLSNGYRYIDPVLDFSCMSASTFAPNNHSWGQYPGHLDIFDGNDMNGESMSSQPFDCPNTRRADLTPQPLKQR